MTAKRSNRGALLLLAATLAGLVVTLGTGFVARVAFVDANGWVTHTDQVRLAIADCRLALARRDVVALDDAEAKLARLTLDNPRQRQDLARAPLLGHQGSPGELDALFTSMRNEEDRLMAERLERRATAQAASIAASIVAGLLTIGLGVSCVAFLRGQLGSQRAAEERVHATEERFQGLVDAVTDYAIFMLDPAGDVVTWNAGAKRIKGYDASEIVGRHFSLFYTPEDRATGKPNKMLEIVRREGHVEDESLRVRKDGSRFWADVVITALRNQNGEVTGFAKVTRDLTARRAGEETERQLERVRLARTASETERHRLMTLLNHLPAIVNFLRGPDLVWDFVHPDAAKTVGGRAAIGKPFLETAPDLRPYYERLRRVYETGEPFVQHEALGCCENGGQRVETYWDSVYIPVRDLSGVVEGVMTFELDVTSAVRTRQDMERVNRAKDEFLATMSHELRTPLNAISGWATILRSKPREEDKLDRGLEVIERNAKAQTRLVSDLLDVSRIITGKLHLNLQKVEVFPLVLAAIDVVRPAADNKGVRLVMEVDPHIGDAMADPDRLQQVVWNLLSNAIRFTPRGGRVTITGVRATSGIVICVRDTGMGVSRDQLPHIFTRFVQVDNAITRAHGGLGLGLAIVRHLVEAHGGDVAAESEGLGRGAIFTVTLPIRAVRTGRAPAGAPMDTPPAPEAMGALQRRTSLKRVRVLIVDDDPDSIEVLRMVLEGAGATVTTTASAREAFEKIDACGPHDVIISDIGMPEVDGYSFMRSVRARADSADVPAIALTAYARAEDAELARRAGYQEHLSKPVDERVLLEAVRAWSRQLGGDSPAVG